MCQATFSVLYSAWLCYKRGDSVYKRYEFDGLKANDPLHEQQRSCHVGIMWGFFGVITFQRKFFASLCYSDVLVFVYPVLAAFSQASGESLSQILVAMQNQSTTTTSASVASPLVGNNVAPLSTFVNVF